VQLRKGLLRAALRHIARVCLCGRCSSAFSCWWRSSGLRGGVMSWECSCWVCSLVSGVSWQGIQPRMGSPVA
jgi:hypothetical protein